MHVLWERIRPLRALTTTQHALWERIRPLRALWRLYIYIYTQCSLRAHPPFKGRSGWAPTNAHPSGFQHTPFKGVFWSLLAVDAVYGLDSIIATSSKQNAHEMLNANYNIQRLPNQKNIWKHDCSTRTRINTLILMTWKHEKLGFLTKLKIVFV
jgi:hypothetical protein